MERLYPLFLPVVYLGFITLFEEKRKPYILSIGLAGILYCHLISAMLTTLSLAIMFFARKYYRDKENIINLIIAALIFFSTTFMYFAPAIEFIKSQKIMVFQGYNVVGTLSENDISLTRMTSMWFVVMIYLAISIIYVITNKKDKESITNSIYAMILLFMCTELFPWKIVEIYIPFVSIIQFTFRILYLLSIPITIMITDLFFKKKMYFYLSLLVVLLFSTQSFVIFTINKPQVDEIIGVGEYLPDNYYINNAKNEFMNGDILLDTLVSEEGRNRDIVKKFTIKNKEGTVKLPVLYYIGYTVKDEKGEALEYYQSEDGFISIDNIQEDTAIIVEYTRTPIQKISEITSVLSMITLCFFTRRKK